MARHVKHKPWASYLKNAVILGAAVLLLLALFVSSDQSRDVVPGEVVPSSLPPTRIVVLMYHKIGEHPCPDNPMVVSRAKFRKDMKYLKFAGYRPLFARDLKNPPHDGGRYVVITFDDGNRSTLDIAYPILREFEMKAAVFVITAYADLASGCGDFLSWKQVKTLSESGIFEIGSHTDRLHNPETGGRYVNKPGYPNGVLRLAGERTAAYCIRITTDLWRSIRQIGENTGTAPVSLAYPFGVCSKEVDVIARRLGFGVTFVTQNRKRDSDDPYNVPRLTVSEQTALDDLM